MRLAPVAEDAGDTERMEPEIERRPEIELGAAEGNGWIDEEAVASCDWI